MYIEVSSQEFLLTSPEDVHRVFSSSNPHVPVSFLLKKLGHGYASLTKGIHLLHGVVRVHESELSHAEEVILACHLVDLYGYAIPSTYHFLREPGLVTLHYYVDLGASAYPPQLLSDRKFRQIMMDRLFEQFWDECAKRRELYAALNYCG